MTEEFIEHIIPELLVLIPVLNAIGVFLKESDLDDWKIPWTLLASSLFLTALWVVGNDAAQGAMAVFTIIIQGVLATATAVFCHQLVIQTKSKE